MPWMPELFSAPALERVEEKRRQKLVTVQYFDGLMSGELDPLIGSFAGEPELHHPVRGRIKGARAFEAYFDEMQAMFRHRIASVEDVDRVVVKGHGLEEAVVHFDGAAGRGEVPVAVVADKASDGRIDELRMYYTSWPLTGRHENRPPVLQPDRELRPSGVVAEYQAALAAGDVEAIVAAFEPHGSAREPAGSQYLHEGRDGLRAFYELLFSNGGGIPLEHCAIIDDKRACGLEYNIVRWGETELPPQAGVAVFVRGETGNLAAARFYDDVNPPTRQPG
jgi:hypothetical protein